MKLLIHPCCSSWLSLKSLWLSELCDLLLIVPSCWRCAKPLSVFQRKRSQSPPRCRLIGSQSLRQQLLKYANMYSPMRLHRNLCWPSDQVIWIYLLGNSAKIGAPRKCINSVLRGTHEITEAKGECNHGIRRPETTWVAPRSVVNLILYPQSKAPGKVNRPFSQEEWECVSDGCLCCASPPGGGAGSLPRTVFLIVSVLWCLET